MLPTNPYNISSNKLFHRQRFQRWVLFLFAILFWRILWFTTKVEKPRRLPKQNFAGWKLLYIVTSLAEYDNGKRKTIQGFDRFQETFIPVLRESVESLLWQGFQVDVVVIAHYNMTRSFLIRENLPESVGLQIWDNASPLGYRM